jgi:hypothetical protein
MEAGYHGLKWYHHDSHLSPTLENISNEKEKLNIQLLQLETLEKEYQNIGIQTSHVALKGYIPLMKRKRCDSLESIQKKQEKNLNKKMDS